MQHKCYQQRNSNTQKTEIYSILLTFPVFFHTFCDNNPVGIFSFGVFLYVLLSCDSFCFKFSPGVSNLVDLKVFF